MKYQVKNPVVLIVFKRLETTRKVLDVLRQVKPRKIYIVGDGPASEEDQKKCEMVRKVIDESIDWDCQIFKNFSEYNMGGPKRVPSGLNWVFDNEEQAIILEDDIIADVSFFRFCDELLEKYKDNKKIMHISGNNGAIRCGKDSYYFVYFMRSLGWATWKRAWQKFDPDMKKWPEIKRNNKLDNIYFNRKFRDVTIKKIYEPFYNKTRDAWDGKWNFSCVSNEGIGIIPNINMTEHIGYGEDAQHTKNKKLINVLPSKKRMNFPLKHPQEIIISKKYENKRYSLKHGYKSKLIIIINGLYKRLKCFLKNF